MSLNPEQLGLVNRAKNAVSPFDIGACFNVAMATLKRDFLNIVLANFIVGLVLTVVGAIGIIPVIGWIAMILLIPPLVIGFIRFNAKCVRGQPATLGDCFSGFDIFGTSVLAYILMILLLLLLQLLQLYLMGFEAKKLCCTLSFVSERIYLQFFPLNKHTACLL